MVKTKVIPGEIIEQFKPALDKAIMKTQLLDIATREQVDTFDFVSIWTSYKKDQHLPKEKRVLKIKNKLQMKRKSGKIFSVTVLKDEKTEIALRRLLAKGRRYELANVMEATLAQQEYNDKSTNISG